MWSSFPLCDSVSVYVFVSVSVSLYVSSLCSCVCVSVCVSVCVCVYFSVSLCISVCLYVPTSLWEWTWGRRIFWVRSQHGLQSSRTDSSRATHTEKTWFLPCCFLELVSGFQISNGQKASHCHGLLLNAKLAQENSTKSSWLGNLTSYAINVRANWRLTQPE